MAKGNDGNLLQHGVEAEVGRFLYREGNRRGLHIICTHGMAPFEKTDLSATGNKTLYRWLDAAHQPELDADQPAVVYAYRHCRASLRHYPNTGEVLAALVGRFNLTGAVVEKNPYRFGKLHYQWQGTSIRTFLGSWRDHIDNVTRIPAEFPWLFTMDPMTFRPGRPAADDANLYSSDLDRLRPYLSALFGSTQAGAVTLFCFSLKQGIKQPVRVRERDFFLEEAKRLRAAIQEDQSDGRPVLMQDFRVRRSNWDIGILLTKSQSLVAQAKQKWSRLSPPKKAADVESDVEREEEAT